jgi:hypothetical protein
VIEGGSYPHRGAGNNFAAEGRAPQFPALQRTGSCNPGSARPSRMLSIVVTAEDSRRICLLSRDGRGAGLGHLLHPIGRPPRPCGLEAGVIRRFLRLLGIRDPTLTTRPEEPPPGHRARIASSDDGEDSLNNRLAILLKAPRLTPRHGRIDVPGTWGPITATTICRSRAPGLLTLSGRC